MARVYFPMGLFQVELIKLLKYSLQVRNSKIEYYRPIRIQKSQRRSNVVFFTRTNRNTQIT